ncbi:MAG: hypothetical protein JW715_00360 [Sedimentisphaerales bacterium]|nr:hypothetical protein [Sedimentisphaerales bacterium]
MRSLNKREKRYLVCLGILAAFFAGSLFYRQRPDSNINTEEPAKETEHYIIYSTATDEQTEEIASVAEIVYDGYRKFLAQLGKTIEPHPKLKMKLYKDREEFRRCNHVTNWYEAFYRRPYCYQYYSSQEKNPYHWAMHEATHQLNYEAANLSLLQWVSEGIACYIATSKIAEKSLQTGEIDRNTYPVWWLHIIAASGDLQTDKDNLSIIPLRAIISGQGGPDLNEYFNLYYLHWWSLTHFLMNYNDGQYRDGFGRLISEQGTLLSFEKNIGKIEDIELQWYQYVIELKRKTEGQGGT